MAACWAVEPNAVSAREASCVTAASSAFLYLSGYKGGSCFLPRDRHRISTGRGIGRLTSLFPVSHKSQGRTVRWTISEWETSQKKLLYEILAVTISALVSVLDSVHDQFHRFDNYTTYE